MKYSNMRKRQKPEPKPSEKNIKFPVEPVKADYLYGLTKKQVQERAAAGWSNEEVGSVSLSTKDIVKKNVFTYFNLIFAVLAVLICLSGSFRDLTFPGSDFSAGDPAEYRGGDCSGDPGQKCSGKNEYAERAQDRCGPGRKDPFYRLYPSGPG